MAPRKNAQAATAPAGASAHDSPSSSAPAAAAPAPVAASKTTGADAPTDLAAIAQRVWTAYWTGTPQRTKLLDGFLAFLVAIGAVQFAYVLVGGGFPFNAFLSGFAAAVGQFVLAVSLRLQTNADNAAEFRSISHERAFADFVFGSLILHFFCINFIN